MRIDARIPLIFASPAEAGPGDALLIEGEGIPTAGRDYFTALETPGQHAPGCACCVQRQPAGLALARLLLARGRGQGPFFTRIIAVTATQTGRAAVLEALRSDPIAASCLVLSQPSATRLP